MRFMSGILLALTLGLPVAAEGQFAGYFGRNSVRYNKADFKILQTEHFDLHYYDREADAALDVARMAERSYARLSRLLSHNFTERKPIILYASHSEFQETNVLGGGIDEGTGGFTDFLRHRNVFPLTGSYAEAEHVLQHEMVHQFQFDIWSRGATTNGVQGIISVNAPLWFGEGMAEYFSLGPVNSNTAMWLRDAAFEGKLPTAREFYEFFPYRFGHALLSYIGDRWGDDAIGAITKTASTGNVESAIRRVLGVSFPQLVDQWRDAVQKQYLPEVASRVKARTMSTPLLTEQIAEGTLHLAPALSPDGSLVAYFSERNSFFVDLYLADGNTGEVLHRLLKSTYSSNYETYRFITSSVSFSPDGQHIAFAAKRGGRDEILIVDARRNKTIRRIKVDLNGVTTPTWSPDGTRLVFSGLDGGLSDLYTINADGTGLTRLTNDKYADLHPVWSPDGTTIAFTTDRGPDTDFRILAVGEMRIGLYRMADGDIELPEALGVAKNVSPQWAPDGQSIAFVSDRNGINNIYLYELADGQAYQLTDFYTGVQGITPLSPALSWASESDRLAFVYFEQGKYDVYTLSSPRLLKREPWSPSMVAPTVAATPALDAAPPPTPQRPSQVLGGGAVYRGVGGFRPPDSLGVLGDSLEGQPPVTIAALMDSADFALPDTSDFTFKKYKTTLSPEFFSRPQIGFVRDNFGSGVTGEAVIVLGDMLGDHQMIIGASLNGRVAETQALFAYMNRKNRLNWGLGFSQQPFFFFDNNEILDGPRQGEATFVTNFRRFVQRSVFGQVIYPFNRFQRFELGLGANNIEDDTQSILEPFDPNTGFRTGPARLVTTSNSSISYLEPSAALVYDNSLFGWVGPLRGQRYRLEVSQAVGDWRFTQATVDYRRYDHLFGPFTLATRALYFGRLGRDADQFQIFGGNTELIRGHTSGSYRENECLSGADPNSSSGCAAFDQLIGSQVGVASAELRFPLFGFLPVGFPVFEGAFFYDVGLVWNEGSTLKFSRDPGDTFQEVRTPLQTFGASVRANVFGFLLMRIDYSVPRNRPAVGGLWALSLGPTF